MLIGMGGTKSPETEQSDPASRTCCSDMEEDAADSLLDGADSKYNIPVTRYGSVSLETLVELEAVVAAEHVFQRLQMAHHESPNQQDNDDAAMENGMRHFCRAFIRRFTELAGTGTGARTGSGLAEAQQRLTLASPGSAAEEALGWDCTMDRSPTPHTHSQHRFGLEDSQSNTSDMSSASAPAHVLPLSIPHGAAPQDVDSVDGDLKNADQQQVRSKSDASPGQKSSFLRRMSFKSLAQSFSPFGKRHSQERKTLTRVPTSGSLPISEHVVNAASGRVGDSVFAEKSGGKDHAAWGGSGIRPRLASAPAAELARIRPVSKYAGAASGPVGNIGAESAVVAAEALSSASSMYNLACRAGQRKSSLTGSTISSGRQSPVNALQPVAIPEHETLKKREEDLAVFLGYHADISRMQAASMVQHGGHGAFLVRASETDPGKFVLTFNGQGRPKHLRFCINEDGRCRVQSAWFESLADMVHFYRGNPIPSESGHTSDATLTVMISREGGMISERTATPTVAGLTAEQQQQRQRSYTSPFAPEAIAAAAARKGSIDPVNGNGRPVGDYRVGGDLTLAVVRKDIKGVY